MSTPADDAGDVRSSLVLADVLDDHRPIIRAGDYTTCGCNDVRYETPDWRLHVARAQAVALDDEGYEVVARAEVDRLRVALAAVGEVLDEFSKTIRVGGRGYGKSLAGELWTKVHGALAADPVSLADVRSDHE